MNINDIVDNKNRFVSSPGQNEESQGFEVLSVEEMQNLLWDYYLLKAIEDNANYILVKEDKGESTGNKFDSLEKFYEFAQAESQRRKRVSDLNKVKYQSAISASDILFKILRFFPQESTLTTTINDTIFEISKYQKDHNYYLDINFYQEKFEEGNSLSS